VANIFLLKEISRLIYNKFNRPGFLVTHDVLIVFRLILLLNLIYYISMKK